MEDNLENLNKTEKNSKIWVIFAFVATFLIFYLCFHYVSSILPQKSHNVWALMLGSHEINYFYEIRIFLKFLICFLLHYLPTFLFLKYVFKKTKNLKKRMWFVALSIPLTNLLYGIIHFFVGFLPIYNAELWYKLWFTDWFYMWTIGATILNFQILLSCFLPSVTLTALIIPKKYLPIKSEIWKTSLLTFAVSISPFVFLILLLLILKF